MIRINTINVVKINVERREQKRATALVKVFKSKSRQQNKSYKVYLLKDRSQETRCFHIFKDHLVYVSVGDKFDRIEINGDSIICSKETELETNQEEADTKVFLCSKHAHDKGIPDLRICAVDSDIAIYSLYFESYIKSSLFVKIGCGNHQRVLDITLITSQLGRDICFALPAFALIN